MEAACVEAATDLCLRALDVGVEEPVVPSCPTAAGSLPLLAAYTKKPSVPLFGTKVSVCCLPLGAQLRGFKPQASCSLGRSCRNKHAAVDRPPRSCGCVYHGGCVADTEGCAACTLSLRMHFKECASHFAAAVTETAAAGRVPGCDLSTLSVGRK